MPPLSYQNRQRAKPAPRIRTKKPSRFPSLSTIIPVVLVTAFALFVGWSRYSVGNFQRSNFNDSEWAEDTADASGTGYKCLVPAAATNGEYVKLLVTIRPTAPPGGFQGKLGSPPLHMHAGLTEEFKILSGRVWYHNNKTDGSLEEGDTISLPAGLPHTIWIEGDEPVMIEVTFLPGTYKGLNMERFFGTFAGLCQDYNGCVNIPPLQLLYTLSTYGVYLVDIPVPLWSFIEVVVPPLAQLLGYQHTYTTYDYKIVATEQ